MARPNNTGMVGVPTGGSNWGTRRSLMQATASLTTMGGGMSGGRKYPSMNKGTVQPSNNWNSGKILLSLLLLLLLLLLAISIAIIIVIK